MKLAIMKVLIDKITGRPVAYRCYIYEKEVPKSTFSVFRKFYCDISCDVFYNAPIIVEREKSVEKDVCSTRVLLFKNRDLIEETIEYIDESGKLYTETELAARNSNMLEYSVKDWHGFYAIFDYLIKVRTVEFEKLKAGMATVLKLKTIANYTIKGIEKICVSEHSLDAMLRVQLNLPDGILREFEQNRKSVWEMQKVMEQELANLSATCANVYYNGNGVFNVGLSTSSRWSEKRKNELNFIKNGGVSEWN